VIAALNRLACAIKAALARIVEDMSEQRQRDHAQAVRDAAEAAKLEDLAARARAKRVRDVAQA
jgi:hypothetical protein